MRLLRYSLLVLSVCLAGCMANRTRADVSRQIQVFGIEMYSGVDYWEIGGVRATEEPCLRGYERSFDPFEVTIGYGLDKNIRKITTRNPATSVFGITPGIPAEEGEQLARQAGLQEVAISKFQGMGINLSLLVDGKGKIFGVTIESRD